MPPGDKAAPPTTSEGISARGVNSIMPRVKTVPASNDRATVAFLASAEMPLTQGQAADDPRGAGFMKLAGRLGRRGACLSEGETAASVPGSRRATAAKRLALR